ncbi:MAG: tetratricopeptide repeat protein [Gallionella sp.]
MSVINQMLNQLEERGAHQVAEQAMVRAVPKAARNNRTYLLASALVLAVGVAAWQWMQAQKPVVASAGVSLSGQNTAAPGNHSGAGRLAKSTTQHQVAQVVAPVQGVISAAMPASRLSFELSSVPLPSVARHETGKSHSKERVAGALAHATLAPARKPARNLTGKQASKTVKNKTVQIAGTPPAKTSVADAAEPAADSALPIKQISPEQRSDAEFRKASALVQQGRIDEAMSGYETALRLDAGNDEARQALVALLLDKKRGKDAERLLKQGLDNKPDQTGFAMMLARLQVERGAVAEATATLDKGLPYAGSDAAYQAFLAALLQRQNRNDEAIAHYQIALQIAPNNGIWLMGYGISLQALKRNADARSAFQQALATRTLNPDLQAFVQQRLKAL